MVNVAAYYNEHDKNAVAWLRNLQRDGLIMDGVVDERSIAKVSPADLAGYRRVHLFAGIAGWDLAIQLADWPSDREVWTGSCPCQPFSLAGSQAGELDTRHLWPEMRRLITKCQPATIFGEQIVSPLGRKWLSGVRADLEELGYSVGAADLCAASVGAPHIRQRLFWVADRDCKRPQGRSEPKLCPDKCPTRKNVLDGWANAKLIYCHDGKRRRVEPESWPLAHGLPISMGQGQPELRRLLRRARSNRVTQIRGYGNAIVPQVAAEFIAAFLDSERVVEQAMLTDDGCHAWT